ncbi:MAG: YfjP family GTPase [Actinomycetota bacterium]|nr:YfjP family GTPase [Actinomycetota bacterium]
MSPFRRQSGDSVSDLGNRVAALRHALEVGGTRLDEDASNRARRLAGKVGERLLLSGDRTVTALAGATGSGKSSLFNAISGAPLSPVGVRRPTTSAATAAIWDTTPTDPSADPSALLRWLAVPSWHLAPAADDALDGLILLDLPDHDSTEAAHRAESDRLVEMVDVFIWVTDPQKYADAALHHRYLAPLAGHDAVTIVVLNQTDRLTPEQLSTCRNDLNRLLRADGLTDVEVIGTSAATGAGLSDLRSRLSDAVKRRTAAVDRLAADLDASAAELSRSVAADEVDEKVVQRSSGLLAALGEAAGAPIVLAAVEAGYRRDATGGVGWPFTRWLRRVRPDPLRRLRIGGVTGIALGGVGAVRKVAGATRKVVAGDGQLPVQARTSLPPPSVTAMAKVDLATRQLGDAAAAGLPPRWAEAAAAAATPAQDDLADALDRMVGSLDLSMRKPLWWRVIGVVQWLLAAAAVVGLGWLLVLAILGWLKIPEPKTPYLGPLPWPTVLLIGGAAIGLLLATSLRPVINAGARRRGQQVRRQLDVALGQLAQQRVVQPVQQVLADHRATREALAAVARR